MEKLIIKPNENGKYIVKLFGTEYEIIIEGKTEEKKDKNKKNK